MHHSRPARERTVPLRLCLGPPASRQGYRGQTSKWTWRPADHSKPTSKIHRVPEASEETWWCSQWQALTRAAKILGRCDDPGSATECLGWTVGCASRCSPTTALILTPPANFGEAPCRFFASHGACNFWSGAVSRGEGQEVTQVSSSPVSTSAQAQSSSAFLSGTLSRASKSRWQETSPRMHT